MTTIVRWIVLSCAVLPILADAGVNLDTATECDCHFAGVAEGFRRQPVEGQKHEIEQELTAYLYVAHICVMCVCGCLLDRSCFAIPPASGEVAVCFCSRPLQGRIHISCFDALC